MRAKVCNLLDKNSKFLPFKIGLQKFELKRPAPCSSIHILLLITVVRENAKKKLILKEILLKIGFIEKMRTPKPFSTVPLLRKNTI